MIVSSKNIFSAIVGITLLLANGSVFAIPIITNGSMTGPPQIGSPPPGWNSVSTDGDTIPVGGLSGWGTGIGPSPDGGTFLALLSNGSGGAYDAVTQVTGFTIGETYTLQFSYANIGLDSSAAANYANSGFIRANVAGVNLDSMLLNHDGFGNQQWFNFTGNFVATAETHGLMFSAERQGTGGYAGGVDGVSITIVPEPASLSFIALVTGGIYFARRFFVA